MPAVMASRMVLWLTARPREPPAAAAWPVGEERFSETANPPAKLAMLPSAARSGCPFLAWAVIVVAPLLL